MEFYFPWSQKHPNYHFDGWLLLNQSVIQEYRKKTLANVRSMLLMLICALWTRLSWLVPKQVMGTQCQWNLISFILPLVTLNKNLMTVRGWSETQSSNLNIFSALVSTKYLELYSYQCESEWSKDLESNLKKSVVEWYPTWFYRIRSIL